jgi:hypothetical protein
VEIEMKIGGVDVTPCEELIVLYRGGEGKDIPIRTKAVEINEEFQNKVPEPIAPMRLEKGGQKRDVDDPDYKAALSRRGDQRFALMCLRSLEPSEIEWQEVDIDKPSTWLKWQDELKSSGISEVEINRIIQAVMVANALDESKLEQARKVFLHGQGD